MPVTIIADDKTVIVNGVSAALPEMPPIDANVHAIQFCSETGHATIEKKSDEREHLAGDAALKLVKPFIDAHADEVARLKVAKDAVGAAGTAAEKATKDRHDRIRAELAAADRKAAEEARAAGAELRRQAEVAQRPAPGGNMSSSGTQAI